MKALVFHHPKKVKIDKVDDPAIEDDRDIIVKVTSTAICGSDLHIYNGFIPQLRNMVLGHEFMGEVAETGKAINKFKKGDRVVVPFPIACGQCFFCLHSLPPHCENSNKANYGPEGGILTQKGGGLFGYTDAYGGYAGGQAEYVRVPYADVGPRKVTGDLKDEEVLFLTDIFPTGWAGVDWAGIKGGETVAVFGCGPVGIMAQKAAWIRGAKRVIGIDILDYRLEIARKAAKSETLLNNKHTIEEIRDMTEGRGADVCIDAVGMECHRTFMDKTINLLKLQIGSIDALKHCISAVRRGGTISILGVYGTPFSNFPLGQLFDKGITLKMGQAPAQNYIDELLKLVQEQKVKLDDIITHTLPLDQAPHAYDIFCKKKDNCLKVILKP